MAAVPYAHIVAQLLGRKHPKGTEITLAPNPKDIVSGTIPAFGMLCSLLSAQIWENLNKSSAELIRKKTMGWFLLITIAFLNTVPLFVLSILANLSSVRIVPPSSQISLLSYMQRLPVLSRSSRTGLKVPRSPSTSSLVYSRLPYLPFSVSSCPS